MFNCWRSRNPSLDECENLLCLTALQPESSAKPARQDTLPIPHFNLDLDLHTTKLHQASLTVPHLHTMLLRRSALLLARQTPCRVPMAARAFSTSLARRELSSCRRA